MTEDAELLRRYAEEKSEAAFAQLVSRHLDLVYSAALRRLNGDAHAAADVTQQVFAALARQASSLTGCAVLPGWLYGTTRHVAVDFIRAEQRRRAREQEAHTMHELDASLVSPKWEQLRPALDAAMDELNTADREAVLLRFFARRPFAEVGAALQLSEDAARMRVDRALEKLRTLLAGRGITSTGAALALALESQGVVAAPAGLGATVTAGAMAGGGTALAGSAITFMSTSKTLIGIAAIVAAVGIGGAVYETREAERLRAELAALRQERDATRAKSVALVTSLRVAEEKAAAEAQRAVALKRELESAQKTTASTNARPATASANAARDLWSRPGYAKLYLEKQRTVFALRYDLLYRALNLSPDKIEKFEATLMEAEQGMVDIWTSASMQGLSTNGNTPTATSIARMTSGPLGNAQERVKDLLGSEAYEKYKEFDQARGARDLVASLAGNLYYTESPLTAQQGAALADIVTAQTKTVQTPMASDGQRPLYAISRVTDWSAVSAQAQAILSPAQLNALRLLGEQTRIEGEIRRVMNPPAANNAKQPGS